PPPSPLFPYTTPFRSIGAGVIAGGDIQRGALGAAGEIGHVPVPSTAEVPCRCGNVNCVEAVAGGTALLARSPAADLPALAALARDRKSTRLNSSHVKI